MSASCSLVAPPVMSVPLMEIIAAACKISIRINVQDIDRIAYKVRDTERLYSTGSFAHVEDRDGIAEQARNA